MKTTISYIVEKKILFFLKTEEVINVLLTNFFNRIENYKSLYGKQNYR